MTFETVLVPNSSIIWQCSVFSYPVSSFQEIYLAAVGVQHFPKEIRPADLVGGEPVFIS
jgi:hypothetical protein